MMALDSCVNWLHLPSDRQVCSIGRTICPKLTWERGHDHNQEQNEKGVPEALGAAALPTGFFYPFLCFFSVFTPLLLKQ